MTKESFFTDYVNPLRHKAILDYLSASGFHDSFTALKAESLNDDFVPDPKQKYAGLLEKKWTSVIRLQKKVHIRQILAAIELYRLTWPPTHLPALI